MSVINRMLQDIDRRRAEAGLGASTAHPDIRRVTRRAEMARPLSLGWKIALPAVASVLLLFAWYQTRPPLPLGSPAPTMATKAPAIQQAAVTQPATPAISEVALPSSSPLVPAVAPAPSAAVVASAAGLVPEATDKTLRITDAAPVTVAKSVSEKLKMSMQLSMLVADTPIARPPVRTTTALQAVPTPVPGMTTITNVPVRQVATDETIAAARALWTDGARADAVATLREALASAESSRNQRAIAPLAREFARLEVADNRPQVALDLLRRLENLFGDDAEAWALRGNAEQRLAMHAEATQSYLSALRLRPFEGKWMLGAAISLAAAGQTDEARVWVERARERDAVTPAIASYLQQLGISARR